MRTDEAIVAQDRVVDQWCFRRVRGTVWAGRGAGIGGRMCYGLFASKVLSPGLNNSDCGSKLCLLSQAFGEMTELDIAFASKCNELTMRLHDFEVGLQTAMSELIEQLRTADVDLAAKAQAVISGSSSDIVGALG